MKIRENFSKNIPLSLALILIFLSLNLSFFLLSELIFSLIQFNFTQENVELSNELVLLAVIISNCLLIVFLLVFLHFNRQQFFSSVLLTKLSVKSMFTIILVSVAFLIILKYEIITWWTRITGEIKVDLLPWPFHLFKPEIYDISYLFFFTLIFLLIQPLWEELLFRRILAGNLIKQGFNQSFTVFLSSFAFSLYYAIYLLVEISINDLLWFILTTFIGGIILGTLFVKTERIRYSYIISIITNLFLLLLFLSQNHFEFIPYRGFVLAISQLIILFGLSFIFFEALQKFIGGTLVLTLKNGCKSLLTYSWPNSDHLKNYWITLIFLFPIIPFGVVVFVDHTVLYTDLFAIILENGINTLILLTFSIFLYYSIHTRLKTIMKNEINTLTFNSSWNLTNVVSKEKFSFKSILRGLRSHIVFIILLLSIISPFYILSVVSQTKVEIIVLFQALVDVSIFIAQNPFFTFQHVITEIRSNIIFIGNTTEILDQLFLFQQSIGRWNFLPDTYMSTSADWIHGLLTVMLWFGILIFYFYLLRNSKKYPLKAALGALLLIIMNFFWILLTMGLGSISEEGGPSGIPPLEDISLLINFDITVREFLILPIGLLLFLIASIIFLLQFIYRKRKLRLRTPIS